MKSGKRYWSEGTPVPGQLCECGFDDIGNRGTTKTGGDEWGAALRSAAYPVNSLNQITQREVSDYLNIIGSATLAATNVNVNNTMAYRRGEYYRVELNPNNTSAAVWQSVTNRAVQSGTTNSVTGNLFLPQPPEVTARPSQLCPCTRRGSAPLALDVDRNIPLPRQIAGYEMVPGPPSVEQTYKDTVPKTLRLSNTQ